ncbi:amino acid adenylation domain-containing protein [Variovorax sp. KBW07]|uniref:non-ribosomal peptide synthetase n=1 Tax=Variovorax sp. KBW07 TaxID=2153358 RepID=UPI0021A9AD66|nr:non-ribosomal peptide synthetase [Variovorax sp. KBW07]
MTMEDRIETLGEPLALSPEQRAVLAMQKSSGTRALVLSGEIDGEIDVARLRRVAADVLQAHEALRLVVHEAADAADWRQQVRAGLPASSCQADAPLPMRQGEMIQLAITRLDAARHRLTLSAHPLAADAGSLSTLFEGIAAAWYGAPADVEAPFQYTQFAAWRHDLAQDEDAGPGQAYWAEHIRSAGPSEAPAAPRLALRQGGAMAPAVRRVAARRIDAVLFARIGAVATAHGVPVGELLQAAWWALVARLTGFTRFVGGWQHDCRRDYELMQGAVGVFAKVLPVHIEVAADESFSAWLGRFHAMAGAHAEAQEYWALDGARGLAQLETGFVLSAPIALGDAADAWRVTQRPGPLSCFELVLEAECADDHAELFLHADAGRYAQVALEALLRQFMCLLQGVADSPQTLAKDLPLVDAREREILLGLEGERLDAGTQGIADRIAHWARTTPEAPAVEEGDRCLSYAALDVRINRMARWMQAQGVTHGAVVALALPRSIDLLVAMFAAWRAGAGYLPLEPEWPAARRAMVLADARPALLLQVEPVQGTQDAGWRVASTADIDLAAFDVRPPDVQAGPQDLAYVLYTSGSTGRPKGVVIEQGQLLNYVAAASSAMRLEGYRRWALTSSVAADLGNTALFGAFFNGACLVVADTQATHDAAAFTRFMATHRIDALKIVPSHLEALLEAETPVLPALLVLGGESASRLLLERIARLAPSCAVYNHYGPTETTVGVMVHKLDIAAVLPDAAPLSRVLANNRVRVLDASRRLVPIGVLGELHVGGAQLCRGYLGRPAREVFIDDPFLPGERLYRTGDLACVLPDGTLRIAGRADHQLKVRGFRVEPGEVEAVLLAQEGVRQAVVMPVAAPVGGVELVAYVVGDVHVLRDRLGALLPAHMVPSRCIEVAAFPRLANGKVDRLALAAAAPAPEAPQSVEPPGDALQHLLASGMAELLGRPSIGVDDDFFELGAHSLLVIKLAARIRRLLQVDIAPGLVFDHPSVSTLAEAVRGASADRAQTEQLADAWRLASEAAVS